MNISAIIPIKEHSERIPNKNIRNFNGKPLYHWILKTLNHVEYIDKIIVDTDSIQIAEMVEKYSKVVISIRPDELRGDFISVNCLIEYILKSFPEHNNFVQTHTTNPLLKSLTLKKAIDKFEENLEKDYDSLFSVNRYKARFYNHEFKPLNHDLDNLIRTQDLNPLYEENSNFYIFSRESFRSTKARIGGIPFFFEMDLSEAIDIDEEKDFILAEKLMKSLIHD